MKKIATILFPLLMAIHLFLGIWWMAIAWGIAWALVWLATSPVKPLVKFRKMTILVYPLLIIGVILAAITFKTLFFGIYVIPSGSMEKTIVPGDVVWVNNLSYGPRLPYSPYEISWINVLVWLWEGKEADVKKRWWKYNRLKGFSSPKNGQVAVFNHPHNGDILIKRIAALPGDTLQIVNGLLYINGQKKDAPSASVFYSNVLFRNPREGNKILDSLDIRMFHQNTRHESVKFNGHLTHSEIESLRKHPQVINAGIDPIRADTAWTVYPRSEELNWTIDNFGPYILPYTGMAIEKNAHNLALYSQLINKEVQDVAHSDSNDSKVYIFEHAYYFLMGDNFHDSHDSRYFGPVPEENLIGKASFIMFSQSKNIKTINRFLRRLE